MSTMRIAAALLCAAALAGAAAAGATSAGWKQPRCRPGVLHRVGTPSVAYSAVPKRAIRAYRRPGGALLATFPRINDLHYPTTFSIVGAIVTRSCDASWYRAKLPMRPNGVVGYVRPAEVIVARVKTRISVDLSRRSLALYRAGRLVLTTAVSVGSAGTPTPIGRYYVNQRITVANGGGPFGPVVLGISAFSNVLQGWAKGGPIAIHGTNEPWSIGRAASHGCVRVPNATLLRVFELSPGGTPVVIHP
jgi:lipoprotein-anchoring transpeptidase ErfK/SrfK